MFLPQSRGIPHGRKFSVVNNQGTITLSGTVRSEEARQAAERVSKKQRGVVLVVNELKVA